MHPLALAFIIASILWTGVSLALSFRQSAHVTRHRQAVPADFATRISLGEHEKAADYTVARERIARIEAVVELGLALAWVLGGINLLYEALATAMPPSLGRGVLFLLGVGVVGAVVNLPFALYRAFVLERRFGFNRTSAKTFIIDRLKQTAISLVVAVPLMFLVLWVMRSFTGWWWLWTWVGLVALMLLAPAVYLRLIAPRFNRFTPLDDAALRDRLEALLTRSGFRSSGLFVMDASRRTAHGNAFFIGFGKAKRIVLFDTLLSHSTPDEIEAVIAHELGHFRHRHVLYGLFRGALILFITLAAFGWLARQPWLLPSFGVTGQDDALSLFVCMLVGSVAGPLVSPLSNWISRKNEFQADDYARRAVGAEPLVSALTGLARDNASTLTPDPVYALVHHSHPSVPIRVRALRAASARPNGVSVPSAAE